MLKEEEVMRFARFSNIESAAATFTQISLDTNLSIRAPYLWRIRALQLEVKATELEWPAQSAIESVMIQFTRESKTGIIAYDDADLLEKVTLEVDRVATVGTDAGPAYKFVQNPLTFPYFTPIVYAGAKIYCGIIGTNSAAITVKGRLGYTLEKTTEKAFFRFAGAL